MTVTPNVTRDTARDDPRGSHRTRTRTPKTPRRSCDFEALAPLKSLREAACAVAKTARKTDG
jgi:hypothetical protein